MSNISDITILIVLYQESDEIVFKTLEQIKNFKKIIIDNDGNHELRKKILEKYDIFEYCLNKKNLGFSKGFNKAINLCKTKFAFIKNADCFIDEQNILKLFDYIN